MTTWRIQTMTIALNAFLTVLVVIAHPDDETLFGSFIHFLTHKLNASVDLVCVTNGEGGNRHAGLSESFYGNLKLSEEAIGRKHLQRIRQQELFGSGRTLGIRKVFFYEESDFKSGLDINTISNEQWDKEWIIHQFQHTIKHGNGPNGYDLMVVILPNVDSSDHHTASGLLALETIDRLQQVKSADIVIPTIIGGSEYDHDRVNEQYFYFAINERYGDNGRLLMVQNLFTQLANLHHDNMKNVLHDSYTN